MLTALKGSQFYFYLLLLQLVLCRVAALKVYPYSTSSIEQIIFSFLSFKTSKGILRNQKLIIGLVLFSNHRLIYSTTLPTLPIEFCYDFKTIQAIEGR